MSDDKKVVPFPLRSSGEVANSKDDDLKEIFDAFEEALETATIHQGNAAAIVDPPEPEFSIDPADPDAVQCPKCGWWNYVSPEKQICSRKGCEFNVFRDIVDRYAESEIQRLSRKRDRIQWTAITLVVLGGVVLLADLALMGGPHLWGTGSAIALIGLGFLVENSSTSIKQRIHAIAQERGLPL